MNTFMGFLMGMFVGAFLAIMITALCMAAGDRDRLDDLNKLYPPETPHTDKDERRDTE